VQYDKKLKMFEMELKTVKKSRNRWLWGLVIRGLR